jgi:hypothetical protein
MNMKHYYFFLLVLLCSCNEQSNSEEPLTEYKDSCELAKTKLAEAIHGTPLVVPLYTSAPPTLFLIPVSDDKDKLVVDRLYLLEYDGNKRHFERNIYNINEIVRIVDDECSKNKAIVTSIADGTFHEFEIDGFMMCQIRKLNKDKFEYKSNTIIPIRYDSIR